MTTPSWLTNLPQQVLVEGYEETVRDGVIRTPMEFGPARYGLRDSLTVWVITFQMLMSAAQRELFDSFMEVSLHHGAKPFNWKHPVSGEEMQMRFIMSEERQPQFHVTTFPANPWRLVATVEGLTDGAEFPE